MSLQLILATDRLVRFQLQWGGTAPPVNTDYFPTTQGSWWSYDDFGGVDSFKTTVNGTTTISGNTFQKFVYSDGATGEDYYRKDAATGFYYQSIDTAGFGPGAVFAQPRLNLLFLKNSLTTGATWNTDFSATLAGLPGVLRFAYECMDQNAALTVNGKSFTNVYEIELQPQVNIAGMGFQDAGTPITFFYARGIGLILIDDGVDQQSIRSWVVN